MDQRQALSLSMDAVVVFRRLMDGPVLSALAALLRTPEQETATQVRCYSAFLSALYDEGFNLSHYLLREAVLSETIYLHRLGTGQEIPPVLQACVEQELALLDRLSHLSYEALQGMIHCPVPLPGYATTDLDFAAEYHRQIATVGQRGWGLFAQHTMFRLQDGALIPACPADPTTLEMLSGYTQQRQQVVENTKALMLGLPAANMLLYGDAGTGKSSTVKAVTNLYAKDGLRLIELQKHQLRELPRLMENLQENPLKFILFIDDLSFQESDDDFHALKGILEGSSCVRSSNVVVYATSNRRHLVKETFSDRAGDDLHLRDSIQETMSLADRFGLTVLFSAPGKALYLQIVHALAQQKGISMEPEELDQQAERFALEKGGRSPRTAEQFTNYLLTTNCGEGLSLC